MTAQGHHNTAGELLKKARQARGHSLAEMSERTKIPPRLLAAIEIDDYQKVAEPLYVKSFLQTYARCLDLDTQEILDLYNRQAGTYAPSEEREQIWEEEVQVRRVGLNPAIKYLRWAGMAAILLVILVLIGRGLWGQRSETSSESMTDELVEFAQDDPVVSPASEPVVPDSSVASLAARGTSADGASQEMSTEINSPQVAAVDTDQEVLASWTEDMRLSGLREDLLVPFWGAEPQAVMSEPDRTQPRAQAVGLPSALRGNSSLVFAGGLQWPLVLRILVTDPMAIRVKADGQAGLVPVRWPSSEAETLPPREIEPGRVYAVAQGYVMYWGARDHFYVLLSSRDAVQVSLNGIHQPVPERNVGREWMLDADALGGQNPE